MATPILSYVMGGVTRSDQTQDAVLLEAKEILNEPRDLQQRLIKAEEELQNFRTAFQAMGIILTPHPSHHVNEVKAIIDSVLRKIEERYEPLLTSRVNKLKGYNTVYDYYMKLQQPTTGETCF